MTRKGQYSQQINLLVTPEMYQFVTLLAKRNSTSINDVIRQAIRAHLDIQEDIITSRSRLGSTVLGKLEKNNSQQLAEIRHISKLVLAGLIVFATRLGMQPAEAAEQIAATAKQPGIARMLEATKK